MKIIKLSAIVFALFSLNAAAQTPAGLNNDWVPAAITPDGSDIHYVNLKSIERNGQIVKVWVASTRSKEKDSSKTLREINCKTNQYRFLSVVSYKDTGFSVTDSSTHEQGAWIHLVPDTIGYVLRDFVCKTK
jgi:hypothetical protein